jgi:hypothetical protein
MGVSFGLMPIYPNVPRPDSFYIHNKLKHREHLTGAIRLREKVEIRQARGTSEAKPDVFSIVYGTTRVVP